MAYGKKHNSSGPSRVSEVSAHSALRETETSRDTGISNEGPDLAVFVQDLLEQMETRFSDMEDSLTTKLETMGEQMDDLDTAISELMNQAGLEPPSPSAAAPTATTGQKQSTTAKFDTQDEPGPPRLLDKSSDSRVVL